ncbi:hypothetical protein [Thermosulfuriphilus sp.]
MSKHSLVKKLAVFLFIGLSALGLSGCGGGRRVYLANEACLIKKGQSNRAEVLNLLGPPDKVVRQANGWEIWYYFNVNKSTLKKFPLLGSRLGREEIEILEIIFAGNQVYQCRYQVEEKK